MATHDILIIGWNNQGDTNGLSVSVLAQGITGRVIITGHDADFHALDPYHVQIRQYAQTFLVNVINYVLQGGSGKTGMIALGDFPASGPGFPYLPSQWGISVLGGDPANFRSRQRNRQRLFIQRLSNRSL